MIKTGPLKKTPGTVQVQKATLENVKAWADAIFGIVGAVKDKNNWIKAAATALKQGKPINVDASVVQAAPSGALVGPENVGNIDVSTGESSILNSKLLWIGVAGLIGAVIYMKTRKRKGK